MPASTTLLVAVVCSAFVISNSAVWGDEPAPTPAPAKEYFPQPTEREARLDAALAQHLSIAFQETPLADVATWFASKLEAPVILDHRSLEDAGIGSETPVTRKVDGISARAALKLVLDDLDLTYLEQDGAILITTQDNAETQLITRVYPVGDLTPLVAATARRSSRPMGSVYGGQKASDAALTEEPTKFEPESPATPVVVTKEEPARMVPDFDSLIEVIVTTVKPQTWDEVGGPGSISGFVAAKCIVVSQTREVHDEILDLFSALRAAKQVGQTVEAK